MVRPRAYSISLAISSIAEGHGGQLWLTLNEGYNMTVHMTLHNFDQAREKTAKLGAFLIQL